MRAVVALALVLLVAGFDHTIHRRDVDVSGAPEIPCAKCHATKSGLLVGRPDYAACYGACHGAPPAKPGKREALSVPPERVNQCTSCHTAASLAQPAGAKIGVPFPPYTPDDFALAVGHLRHKDVACAQCHSQPKATPAKRTPHRRCIGCHDGSGAPGRGPPMTACAGCHTPGSGSPQPPALAEPNNTVTATFSHEKHAARGAVGAQCTTCHAPIAATDDQILPRPVAPSCAIAGCHDGKPTFGITDACTRCHTQVPAKYEVIRYDTRFSHTSPAHATAQLPCATCHRLGRTGEALVGGHAPCASCHADEFAARDPKICFACHNATEPWRPLVADRLPRERTELGASLDHGKHPGECTGCHVLRTPAAQLRPPRGHAACTTSGCHAVQGGPAPQLTACESCHMLGLAAKRAEQRLAVPWSTRAKFDHAPHARTKDGAAVACTSCHTDLAGASVLEIRPPAKATCAPCHDGKSAFKLTGTGCKRCHD